MVLVYLAATLAFGVRSHPSATWVCLSLLWWCAWQLCAGWSQIMEYGDYSSFCSVRHPVQVAPGLIIARFGCWRCEVDSIDVRLCGQVLWYSRWTILRWARPKLSGSDSRLNLVHHFATSCCYGFSRTSGLRVWLLYLSCFQNLIESVFKFFFLFICFVLFSISLSKTKMLDNNIFTYLPPKKNCVQGTWVSILCLFHFFCIFKKSPRVLAVETSLFSSCW